MVGLFPTNPLYCPKRQESRPFRLAHLRGLEFLLLPIPCKDAPLQSWGWAGPDSCSEWIRLRSLPLLPLSSPFLPPGGGWPPLGRYITCKAPGTTTICSKLWQSFVPLQNCGGLPHSSGNIINFAGRITEAEEGKGDLAVGFGGERCLRKSVFEVRLLSSPLQGPSGKAGPRGERGPTVSRGEVGEKMTPSWNP